MVLEGGAVVAQKTIKEQNVTALCTLSPYRRHFNLVRGLGCARCTFLIFCSYSKTAGLIRKSMNLNLNVGCVLYINFGAVEIKMSTESCFIVFHSCKKIS